MMTKKKNIKFFIIIKDNSFRLPNKNFKKILNIPLYKFLFDELKHENVFIDTDSKRILNFINKNQNTYKNFTAYERDKRHIQLENLKSFKLSPVLLMVEGFIKKYCNPDDIIVCTHVTSPFVKKSSVYKAIQYLNQGYDTISSATTHYDYAVIKKNNNFKELNFDPKIVQKTQDLNPVIFLNSAFFIFTSTYFLKNYNRVSKKHYFYELNYPESIDINYKEDFLQAKDYIFSRSKVNKFDE